MNSQTVIDFIPQERRTQKQDLLDYLNRRGSITCMEAFLDLGICQLSARICELEKDGWTIPRDWHKGVARNGRKFAVMRYTTPTRDGDD